MDPRCQSTPILLCFHDRSTPMFLFLAFNKHTGCLNCSLIADTVTVKRDMGNCATLCNNKGTADVNLTAQIPSSTKNNIAKKEHSVVDLASRPQLSSMEQETSFPGLSKTESFFDSNPWLESDCEDFFSVNGDSRGNSPKNQKSFEESSPTNTKKQLIELFRESSNDD